MRRNRSGNWVNQLVVGFGFLNGIWFAIGLDPSSEVIKRLTPAVSQISPTLATIFSIIPLILTGLALFWTFRHGRLLGILSVGIAFVGGYLILQSIWMSLGLLVLGYILGIFAFK